MCDHLTFDVDALFHSLINHLATSSSRCTLWLVALLTPTKATSFPINREESLCLHYFHPQSLVLRSCSKKLLLQNVVQEEKENTLKMSQHCIGSRMSDVLVSPRTEGGLASWRCSETPYCFECSLLLKDTLNTGPKITVCSPTFHFIKQVSQTVGHR